MEAWQIWVLVTLSLFVAEVFHPVFFFAALGTAAAIATVSSFFVSLELQLLVFATSGLVVFFAIRPSVLKYIYSSKETKTNISAMEGKTAIVIEDIIPESNQGRVKVGEETWIGISMDSTTIQKGERVVIVKAEGTKLYVIKERKKDG